MTQTTSASERSTKIILWLARILGTLSVVVFLFFFVSDVIEKGRIPIDSDRVIMTVFMFLTFAGLIVAWKWEGIGGIMALIGVIGYNIFAPESFTAPVLLFMSALYGVPAFLFIIYWWKTR